MHTVATIEGDDDLLRRARAIFTELGTPQPR
jgi:hypothetical protein